MVRIGKAFQPFPPSKRSMRLSPHCAFRFGPRTHKGQIHGEPRGGAPKRETSSSSAFLPPSVCSVFCGLPLADLHRVLSITERHLITTPPPSSSPQAGIFAPRRVQRFRSSQVLTRCVRESGSFPLHTERIGSDHEACTNLMPSLCHFGSGVSSRFSPVVPYGAHSGIPSLVRRLAL